jgi:two-component sensor histidine kinase
MFREAKRDARDLHLLLQFIYESSVTETVEQVYAEALTAVQEIFAPDRAFVALSASGSPGSEKRLLHPGLSSDVTVPIYSGGKLMGHIMIQYDAPHPFTRYDVGILEVIAVHSGFFIERIREREEAGDAQRQKPELIAGAAVELDVVTILERVIQDIQPAAAANNTTIKTSFPGPVFAHGDAQLLWQTFWNLLANSIHLCPKGELRITASSNSADVKICIQGNGVGIIEDLLPHIFDRFPQRHVSRVKSDLVLGLAVVKDLVTLQGGTVSAESDAPGKGTSFTVLFPNQPRIKRI